MSTKTNPKKCLIVTILMLSGLLGTASVSLAAQGAWTVKADMPTTRLALAASVVDGKIYAIGGRAEGTLTTEYDPATDTWTTKTRMPTARFCLATGVVDGKIYAIGGTLGYGTPSATFIATEEYDPVADIWTQKTDMPTARGVLSASVVDGKIYAIGGVASALWITHLRTVEEYDPLTDTWTKKADMPTARAFLSTCVVDGKIYAIGGALASKTMLSTVEVYDPATDTWTRKAPMPTARFGHTTAVVEGIIYAIGGGTHTPSSGFSVVEAYDPATDTWTTKADLPAKTCWHSTGVVDGKIYAFGGSPSGYEIHPPGFRTVYEYDPNPLVVDFNGDGIVDSADMCLMVDHWHTDEPFYDIAPAPFGDGIVDVQDLILLSEHLFEEFFPIELIECWKLDEEEGNIAYNSISDNYGIISGDPTWQPDNGQVAGTLEFDGINDYVETDFVLNPTDGAFSVFAWIQGGAPGQVIISQADGIGTGETWLGITASDGNLMTGLMPYQVGRTVIFPLESQSLITDGQWHHVGFVWDGSYRSLYVDGTEVAKDTNPITLSPLIYSNGGLYIGAGKTLDAGTFFSGLIDDVRIYNVAQSADEIAAMAR